MNQTQLDGITKARLVASIARVQANQQPYDDDAAYLAKVCADAGLESLPDYAADSYAAQHAGDTIAQLEQALADAIEAAQDEGNVDLPPPTVDGVPTRITPAQGEEQLRRDGLLETVLGYIGSLPVTDPMSIAYRRAQWWERSSPSLQGMLKMLGKDDAAADAFFVTAAQIRL